MLVPALVLGLLLSNQYDFSAQMGGELLYFGEPLLFQQFALWLFEGEAANLNLHPIGWAAWFGLIATEMNLLPMSQLDSGHIVYAVFGRRVHRIVSHVTFFSLVALSVWSWPTPTYLVFALLIRFIGFRHPKPVTEVETLKRGRIWLAIIGLVIFVLTFIPVPITIGGT